MGIKCLLLTLKLLYCFEIKVNEIANVTVGPCSDKQ